ncbi:WhiB family transcriptional regulator, redox-sensing transcriptional regulator [Nocardia amikacinitolerans]|uniref:Transcriptional regulator WhiB n=1 Tax=Nocardia amikacinitolerans TaxID=756689 RepID=A0A285KYB9_9NOCA|nr:WhiB family transcriptional regulator [Nocardia amikacinitolerans]MCP2276235.1 WhiB family transcriptional regulator, redox-sensing transcriptional regulator [Nocardia amikacinitolerans]MCP2294499.1 WhiB family transcriptional regulator, redox-sensing transcriptional regulator [Nocardia amikacinitolerans]SNY77649.1 WhiB family transcriptional regulator, redox-sensing transcriptional regulator [Nocardia amikacinitolerans]
MRPTREKPLQLPAPRAEAWAWQMHATCRAYDVNDFYDTGHESRKMLAAKKICADCPVLTRCRDHAVAANEPHGIWGGMTPRERARYRWVHYRPNRL